MAAANASPTYRGRTTGQALHNGQRQIPPPTRNLTGSARSPMTTSQTRHNINGTTNILEHSQKLYPNLPRDLYQESRELEEISDDQLYLPDSRYKVDGRGMGADPSDRSSNVLVAKGLPSHETHGSTQDLEIQHLRTQVKSISVLQDLLDDARLEIQGLQEVADEQDAILRQHGLEVRPIIQEKLSRLRLGSSIVPESEWSVELKRPPGTIHIDGRDQVSHWLVKLSAAHRAQEN